jgi:uncharacterized membrane protein YgcG
MSAEPRHPDSETENGAPSALHLTAVRERGSLRVVGASEPAAEPEAPAEEPAARPALALAPAARRRRRIPAIIATILGVLAALGFVLLLNISMSSNQYDLVQLRSEQRTLMEENQAIGQEIQYQQAPQNLAIRASQLGMVAATEQGQLDVGDSSLSGEAKPAEPLSDDRKEAENSGQVNLIDPPKDSDTDAASEAEKRAAEQEKSESGDGGKPSGGSSESGPGEGSNGGSDDGGASADQGASGNRGASD